MEYPIFLHALEYFFELTSSCPGPTEGAIAFPEARLGNGRERLDEHTSMVSETGD
jgi:hypothetical protein